MNTLLAVGPAELVVFGGILLVGALLLLAFGSGASSLRYDPKVLQAHAERLDSQADSIVRIWALLGFVAGLAAWALVVGILPVPEGLQMMLGLCSLGLSTGLGVVGGRARALSLRVQAQELLWKIEMEKNSRPPEKADEKAAA